MVKHNGASEHSKEAEAVLFYINTWGGQSQTKVKKIRVQTLALPFIRSQTLGNS